MRLSLTRGSLLVEAVATDGDDNDDDGDTEEDTEEEEDAVDAEVFESVVKAPVVVAATTSGKLERTMSKRWVDLRGFPSFLISLILER